MARKKLPTTLYARWEPESDRPGAEQFLVCDEEWDTHAALGERRVVGTYQLVEVSDVISETRKIQRKGKR